MKGKQLCRWCLRMLFLRADKTTYCRHCITAYRSSQDGRSYD
jgi:hypothetical protein